MEIISIPPEQCRRWQYADRSSFEFGDTHSLGRDIQQNGQIEAAIVREIRDAAPFTFEVIAGSRRHKACLEMGLPLQAVVRNVPDAIALVLQYKENDKQPICDYSKGLHFSRLIEQGIVTVSALAAGLQCSKRKIGRMLTYAHVPSFIWEAVGNMSKVSCRAADTIYSLSQQGELYQQALVECAEDIRDGAGSRKIEKLVNQIVQGDQPMESQRTIKTTNGVLIGKWKKNALVFEEGVPIDQDKIERALLSMYD